MDERYELADENGMSHEFADWFFDEKKAGCGNAWFMMMVMMWEGWKGREGLLNVTAELPDVRPVAPADSRNRFR
ncbi:hypothetical protein [Trabulsiella odontotermitis]|uniref:hypothetical protein n=1 Tax=Trabulsiella odontotermitis TaxID=379893 RepID=UPI0006767EFB|nr:hypothetical protein [Trabulsiella odontotermitis]